MRSYYYIDKIRNESENVHRNYIQHIINIKYDPLNIQICYRLFKYFYDLFEMYICTKYFLITIRIFKLDQYDRDSLATRLRKL